METNVTAEVMFHISASQIAIFFSIWITWSVFQFIRGRITSTRTTRKTFPMFCKQFQCLLGFGAMLKSVNCENHCVWIMWKRRKINILQQSSSDEKLCILCALSASSVHGTAYNQLLWHPIYRIISANLMLWMQNQQLLIELHLDTRRLPVILA